MINEAIEKLETIREYRRMTVEKDEWNGTFPIRNAIECLEQFKKDQLPLWPDTEKKSSAN